MSTDRIRQNISLAITSYKTQFVELERIVDVEGYQPTLTGLNDASRGKELSQFWVALDLDGQEGQQGTRTFVDSLSIKSKGLLLTSSLMTDNHSLYVSMRSSIKDNAKGLYSQDLYSLLSDEFAAHALSEMTRRAARNPGELAVFNTSLQSIAASVSPSEGRESIKTGIVSSRWVDECHEASKEFLTLVEASPETVEATDLKANPLEKFLALGLKLTIAATVLGELALVGVWGVNFANKSETVGYVDLSSRPTIETSIGKGQFEQRKIVNYGEFDGTKLLDFYRTQESFAPLRESIDSLTSVTRAGHTELFKKGDMSEDEAVCLVQHKQSAPLSEDGNFYIFQDKDPTIADKKYVDFHLKSHEAGHCFFFAKIDDLAIKYPETSIGSYNASLNEVAADLTVIVDYMRLNGNADIYHDYIRPSRMVRIHDNLHRTAWAIDEIIGQIDSVAMQRKSAEEVPEVVRFLMEKNFMAKDGSYNPGLLSRTGTMELEQPAARALWKEVMTVMDFDLDRNPEFKSQLKQDLSNTYSNHVAKYQGVAPAEVIQAAQDGYARVAEKYGLEPLKVVSAPQTKLSKPMESMMNAFL